MQIETVHGPEECVRIFQDSIKRRPLRLKPFPFRCERPQISGDRASIAASFQIAEPYGSVTMRCERVDGATLVVLATDGNIRGTITAKSMAKAIARRLG